MNKGRKAFSILFIIVIIIAIVLAGYVAYNYIRNYIISQEAASAVDEFENSLANTIPNVITVEVGDNEEIINTVENTSTNNTSTQSTIKYKGYNIIGTIQIPKTNVKYPIVDSITPQAMETAIVMLYGPGLNEIGNTIIVGHNYRNGGFFGNNKKLVLGDKIYITDSKGNKVEYSIYNTYTTEDSDFSYSTRQTDGKREISLSTCTSNNSKRLIIWARES